MKRTFKTGVILQIVFFIGCIVALTLKWVYTVNHDVPYLVYEIGDVFSMISVVNPLGLIGLMLCCKASFNSNLRNSKGIKLYLMFAPALIVLAWFSVLFSLFIFIPGRNEYFDFQIVF